MQSEQPPFLTIFIWLCGVKEREREEEEEIKWLTISEIEHAIAEVARE